MKFGYVFKVGGIILYTKNIVDRFLPESIKHYHLEQGSITFPGLRDRKKEKG